MKPCDRQSNNEETGPNTGEHKHIRAKHVKTLSIHVWAYAGLEICIDAIQKNDMIRVVRETEEEIQVPPPQNPGHNMNIIEWLQVHGWM